LSDEPADADHRTAGPALQLKVRLLELSPMVWRRLLVPANVLPLTITGALVKLTIPPATNASFAAIVVSVTANWPAKL
jgi:hypothetical protein